MVDHGRECLGSIISSDIHPAGVQSTYIHRSTYIGTLLYIPAVGDVYLLVVSCPGIIRPQRRPKTGRTTLRGTVHASAIEGGPAERRLEGGEAENWGRIS